METLFGDHRVLTTREKTARTRKLTNKLTSDAIEYLNSTGQFLVHRQNNIPSTRISRKIVSIPDCYDKEGNPKVVEYEEVKTSFKSNQKEFALLDIAGITLPFKDMPGGLHVEIEVKYGSDTLASDQKDRIKSIKNAGGISFSISSMETLKLQVKPYLYVYPEAF